MRSFRVLSFLTSALCLCSLAEGAENLLLAETGRSAYRIVVAKNASPSVEYAAEELQMFLARMTGAELPIVSDREQLMEREIIIGDNAHLRQAGIALDISSLGTESATAQGPNGWSAAYQTPS